MIENILRLIKRESALTKTDDNIGNVFAAQMGFLMSKYGSIDVPAGVSELVFDVTDPNKPTVLGCLQADSANKIPRLINLGIEDQNIVRGLMAVAKQIADPTQKNMTDYYHSHQGY